MPTIYNYLGSEEQRAAAEIRLADQKAIKKKMKILADGKFIARIIGYCQILNSYAKASLDSQHVKSFPTTVLESVDKENIVLENASKDFVFESEELLFAGIGKPSLLIENLRIGTGIFKPHVTARAKQRRAGRINIERQHRREVLTNLGENAELVELHDVMGWKDATEDVTAADVVVGEISVEDFTDDDLSEVKKGLAKICEKLKENLDDRLRKSELMKTAQHVLSSSFDWFDIKLLQTDQGQQDLANKVNGNLSNLATKMGAEWKEELDLNDDDVFVGYCRWINLCKSDKNSDLNISDEKLWQIYYEKYKDDERSEIFIRMFQRVQLKTYSEAIAETVGSVMTLAQARFRNLEPVNFSKEIFLRFNLPPLHVLKLTFIPATARKLMEYKEFHRR